MTFLAAWGCASDFFKDATKIKNGRQRSTQKNFVDAKPQKLGSQKLYKFYYHLPHHMDQIFWGAQKLKKLNLSIFF